MAKKKKNPYIDPQQRELHELIELKKLQQAAAENQNTDTTQFFQKEEKLVPKTFKEKWKNYWYHYKTTTWVTVFIVILGVWLIKDIFFGTKYDLSVAAASKYTYSAVNQNLSTDFAKYIEDYNGDGKVNVLYDEMTISAGENTDNTDAQMNAVNIQKLMAVMAAGDELVFIMDQDVYDMMTTSEDGTVSDIFVNLEELYPDQTDIIKGDKLVLNSTRLGKKMGINKVEEDVFLCVRALGGTADGSKEKIYNAYLNSLDFVHNIMVEEYPVLRGTETPIPAESAAE